MKQNQRSKLSVAVICSLSLVMGNSSTRKDVVKNSSLLRFKEAIATRTDIAPVIDGVVDDPAWADALSFNDFLQDEPYNLEEPSLQTDVRVLYDDDFLYISFYNYDPEPENIRAPLARRDDYMSGFGNNADWIGVGIDSRNDDKNGYWFALNAAAVQMDIAISPSDGHRGFDGTWNAVWDGKVFRQEDGWSAEIRIPFNVLQYSRDEVQEWGVSFNRGIHRLQERTEWPGKAKGARGNVPHFGVLTGIKNIPQPKKMELRPYVLGGQIITESSDIVKNVGLDIRYGVSSSTSMNFAFNPDFGQVETDPSILNLSAFETRLDERRPFFVEGANFFKNRINLFHSRRIGQSPGFYSPAEGSIVHRPDATTILGATKILGETSSGMKYGIIEVLTDEEYGTWEFEKNGKTEREQFLLEPYTNYFIGRVEQPVINDISTVGFMATNLHRQGAETSNAYNMDWRLKLMENKLFFQGQMTHSNNMEGDLGYAGRFSLSYRDPVWWEVSTWGGATDKNFDVNALGFMRRNNNWDFGFRSQIRRDIPKGIFLNQSMSLRIGLRGSGNDLITGRDIDIEQNNIFMNYWSIKWSTKFNPQVYEDDDLFRDSRAMVILHEAWESYELELSTDRRKRMIFRPSVDFTHGEIRGWGREYKLSTTVRPTDYINMTLSVSNEYKPSFMQWVGIVEDSVGTANIIYAESEQWKNIVNLRLNWAFSPTMTLECFYQPFKVDMDYVTYNRLTTEKTFDVEPFAFKGNKDFRINNQVGTFVFRWEYLPGSLLYLVYNLNYNRHYSSADEQWFNSQSNSMFLKVNYFFTT